MNSADHRVLTGAYGVTKSEVIADGIARARSPEEIFALEEREGREAHREGQAQRLVQFVARYVANLNARGERPASGAILGPPGLFISHRDGATDTGTEIPAGISRVNHHCTAHTQYQQSRTNQVINFH